MRRYESRFLGWGSNQKLPDRAKKYFTGHHTFPGGREDFAKGCAALALACGHDAAETIAWLADHLDEVVEEQNNCIDVIAEGAYVHQRTTCDKAVVGCQTWPLAFSEEGKAFALKQGVSRQYRGFHRMARHALSIEIPRRPDFALAKTGGEVA